MTFLTKIEEAGNVLPGPGQAAGQSGMRLNLVFNSYFIDRGSLYRRGPGSCDDSLRRIC